MNSEQKQFLSLPVAPARLNSEQAAWWLGFQEHDIPVLVGRGLLKHLGNPPPNGMKYFAAADLSDLKTDRRWLARATDAIHSHWKNKNDRRRTPPAQDSSADAPD